jgi:hypothetical protein
LRYRYRETFYDIAVRRTDSPTNEELGALSVTLDGIAQAEPFILLNDDRLPHHVDVQLRRNPEE